MKNFWEVPEQNNFKGVRQPDVVRCYCVYGSRHSAEAKMKYYIMFYAKEMDS